MNNAPQSSKLTIRYDVKDANNYREIRYNNNELWFYEVVAGITTLKQYKKAELV